MYGKTYGEGSPKGGRGGFPQGRQPKIGVWGVSPHLEININILMRYFFQPIVDNITNNKYPFHKHI
jgi:hypothetical protein